MQFLMVGRNESKAMRNTLYLFWQTIKNPKLAVELIVESQVSFLAPVFFFVLQIFLFSITDFFEKGAGKFFIVWLFIYLLFPLQIFITYYYSKLYKSTNPKFFISSLFLSVIPNLFLFPLSCYLRFSHLSQPELILDIFLFAWKIVLLLFIIKLFLKTSIYKTIIIWFIPFIIYTSVVVGVLTIFEPSQEGYKKVSNEVGLANDDNALFDAAIKAGKEEKYEKSILLFKKLLEKHPNNSTILYNTGLSFMAIKMDKEGMEYLEKSLESNPRHKNSYNALGMIYFNSGDYANAKKNWERALEIDPDNEWTKEHLDLIPKYE